MLDKSWKRLSSVYIGTTIGAGFASGQEIIQFFGVYGYQGIFGGIIASFLFSLIGAIVLLRVYERRIKEYNQFITPIFGKNLGKIIETIVTTFLFIGYCVMLAGSGAIFNEQLQLSFNLGIYIMALCTFLTFIFSIKGISVVNTILVPFLLIGIATISIGVIFKEGFVFSNFYGANITKTGNWITSTILYVSYNSVSAMVIMTTLLPIMSSKKGAVFGGVMGGIGLGIMLLFILIPTLILYTDIKDFEIPMLSVASLLGNKVSLIYTFILWASMFTTAIASGYGVIKKISNLFNVNQRMIAILFCIVTMPLAKVGFANLVSIFYPLYGYMGFFIISFIIINFVIRRTKRLIR